MLTRSLALLVFTLTCCWLGGCTSAPATAETGPARPKSITAIDGLFPTLEKGMSGAIIREKLGNPAQINPMESPEGKAEVWVYHFEKTVGMTQIASGTRNVPAFGAALSIQTETMVAEPVYTMAAQKAVVTLSLLMFNDHLAAQKAQVENSPTYQ